MITDEKTLLYAQPDMKINAIMIKETNNAHIQAVSAKISLEQQLARLCAIYLQTPEYITDMLIYK